MNPHDYLADLLESVAHGDLARSLDDEIVRIDPVESQPSEDVPIESGPIVYYPEDDPNYDPNDPIVIDPVESPSGGDVPIESGPIVYYPEDDPNYDPNDPIVIDPVESQPGGEDIPIGGCWGTGHQDETDPGEGEVSIQPVEEEAPAEAVLIEPDPEQEPGPEMSIQPVEEDSFEEDSVEADVETMA